MLIYNDKFYIFMLTVYNDEWWEFGKAKWRPNGGSR